MGGQLSDQTGAFPGNSGYAGQLNPGQSVFYGLGAYV
jgi:hypothetical protein